MKQVRFRRKPYPGPTGMFVSSFLLHLALLFLVLNSQLLPEYHPPEQTTYYVDMVSLPVASPREGAPEPARQPAAAPLPAPAPPPAPAAMTYPTKPAPKAKTAPTPKPAPAKPPPTGKKPADAVMSREEAQAFDERMAQLEQRAEEKRQADVLERLRKGGVRKGATPGAAAPTGSPTGKGAESGSDYAAYIHSRLKDAFAGTIAYQTKSPQITVRLTIGTDGRLTRYRVERSSGDKLFEDAVDRAVHIAEKAFRKPPGGTVFEQGFVFRPQGIGIK